MWIRSQDKEFLIKVDNVNLGLDVNTNELNRLFTFVGGAVTSLTLGTYNSKERAIEVLNEIQTWIERYEAAKVSGKLFIAFITYEMPKEWLNEKNNFIS